MLHGWVMLPQRLGPRGIGAVMYSTFGPFSFRVPMTSDSRMCIAACSLTKALVSRGSFWSSTLYL